MDPLQAMAATVNQAVKILETLLACAQDGTQFPEDDQHPMNISLNESFQITCVLNIRLDRLTVQHGANRIVTFLKDQKVDYTLLLNLQLCKSIRSTSESISYLDGICASMKVDTTSRYFYQCVWKRLEEEGISPVTPDKYITATKKNVALEEYESVKKFWGSHSPLFLQTYCKKDGRFADNVYFIYRTAQDGVVWLLDVLKAGSFVVKGRVYDVCGAFEHVISPTTLTCQIYDCEVMSKAFGDLKSVEEVKEMILCFPQCISSIMIENDLIGIEDIVTYVVKDRTRQVAEDNFKVSNHFIGNICAPKHIHRHATDICLRKWKDTIDDASSLVKSAGLIPESLITNTIYDSILTLDYSAIKSNGFTTAFSRKSQHEPFPRMLFADEICAGEVYARHECLKEPHDLLNPDLSDAQRRMLIYVQLYTVPKKEMLCYAESAVEAMIAEDAEVIFFCLLLLMANLAN